MQSLENIQRHLGSMFVTGAFLDKFSRGLATNIAMTISMTAPESAPRYMHSADAALPLVSILRAAHDIGSNTTVTDEESLGKLLESVHAQFEVVDECNETDAKLALETLEHVFKLAAKRAREALKEVQAGFPVSGGDFAVWKHELSRR
jgi:hypothetical protein